MNANIEWLLANAGRGDIILSAIVMVVAIFAGIFLALALRS